MNVDSIFSLKMPGISLRCDDIEMWKEIFIKAKERSIVHDAKSVCEVSYDIVEKVITFNGPSHFYYHLGQEAANYVKEISDNRD